MIKINSEFGIPTLIMVAVLFDLTGNYVVEQGATYNSLVFVHPDNFSGWSIRGKIRKDYADNLGLILTDFNFYPLTFGTITTFEGQTLTGTIIRPFLTATQTQALPLPPKTPRGNNFIAGKNAWVYDIEIELVGEIIRLLNGFITISPEVTR